MIRWKTAVQRCFWNVVYDRFAHLYDAVDWFTGDTTHKLRRHASAYLPAAPARVLEVGMGTGKLHDDTVFGATQPQSNKETKMNVPEYVSKEEVRKFCQELGIRDWTQLAESVVQLDEARIIQAAVGAEAAQISLEEFHRGLEVELEHGLQFPDANVTNNHPILTAMIVLAHLKEMLDYYLRLEVAELEGDLFKANVAGDAGKASQKYRQLVAARAILCEQEAAQMARSVPSS